MDEWNPVDHIHNDKQYEEENEYNQSLSNFIGNGIFKSSMEIVHQISGSLVQIDINQYF